MSVGDAPDNQPNNGGSVRHISGLINVKVNTIAWLISCLFIELVYGAVDIGDQFGKLLFLFFHLLNVNFSLFFLKVIEFLVLGLLNGYLYELILNLVFLASLVQVNWGLEEVEFIGSISD